ncbi:MAG: hypothetical protein J6D03_00770 [Clostridia bacterium]|nr:hypothetical protein [Clostridia bacterium]
MDALISTSKNPYQNLWIKRGSQYLTKEEFDEVIKNLYPYSLIGCESKECIGTSAPIICSEDLSILVCTESEQATSIVDDVDKRPIITNKLSKFLDKLCK